MSMTRHIPDRLPERWRRMALTGPLLSEYTTMRVGGPAACLIEIRDPASLVELVRDLHRNGLPWRLMGGGSNLVMDDAGIDDVLIRFCQGREAFRREGDRLIAQGGAPFSDLAEITADWGFAGAEFAAGIPGTLGGAVCGNAGAFGEQVGDIVERLTLLGRDGTIQVRQPGELGFAYRHSALKQSGEILLEACVCLPRGEAARSRERIAEIMDLRRSKHPDIRVTPCSGSFFRNIEPTSAADRRQAAGAFLEEVGAKAMQVGGAAVYPKHANIIINTGTARCSEIVALARRMRQAVFARFGLSLIREVAIWSRENLDDLPGG